MLIETTQNSGYFYVIDPNNSHLGGNLKNGDVNCTSYELWNHFIVKYNVKTMLDIGSADGITAKYFMDKGVECLGIEGLHENVVNSLCPVIELDLTKGFYKSEKLFDLSYSMETAEHIAIEFVDNFITSLCNGRIIALTAAPEKQLGYHHVNTQNSWYWIEKIESKGYKFLSQDTMEARAIDKTSYFRLNGLIFEKCLL